jgi:hypothetical protein
MLVVGVGTSLTWSTGFESHWVHGRGDMSRERSYESRLRVCGICRCRSPDDPCVVIRSIGQSRDEKISEYIDPPFHEMERQVLSDQYTQATLIRSVSSCSHRH